MRPAHAPFAAAAALLLAACATAAQHEEPAALAGCYYFEQDDVMRQLGLPWGIRLRAEALQGFPSLVNAYEGVRVASTLTGDDEVDVPFSYWRPLAADSLLVGYPIGGSIDLHLVPVEGGLAGIARTIGDATLSADRPTHPVRLTRARCPEEL